MIGVIEYRAGNIQSVLNGFVHLGRPAEVVRDESDMARCAALVLPGVGAFGHGMNALRELGLVDPIRRHVDAGRPLLGICLGMQLLFRKSDEFGEHEGLGLLEGSVTPIPRDQGFHVPHVGWNDVNLTRKIPLVDADDVYYFVHSFCCHCEQDGDRVGTTRHATTFDSVVARENVYGVQFHPEKSHHAGLRILDRFGALAC